MALSACADGRGTLDEGPTARRGAPVVGGTLGEPCETPSTVAITDADGWSFCSGTLVADDVVVTAAHCLEDDYGDPEPASALRVVYGYQQPALAPPADLRRVATAIEHPSYDPYAQTDSEGLGPSHDIGVIVLEEPIPNAVPAGIVDLASMDDMLVPGRELEISGYGVYAYTGDPEDPGPDGLLYEAFVDYLTRSQTELLSGSETGADTCFGDSGGPCYAVEDGELWVMGATSRAGATATTDCGDKSIYTLVPAYRSWIATVAGKPVGTVPGRSICPGQGGAGGVGDGGQGVAGQGLGQGAGPSTGGEAGSGGTQGASTEVAGAVPASDDDSGCSLSQRHDRAPWLRVLFALGIGWATRSARTRAHRGQRRRLGTVSLPRAPQRS